MSYVRTTAEPSLVAPSLKTAPWWRSLFGSVGSAIVTLLLAGLLMTLVPKLLSWGIVNGVWEGRGTDCHGAGACWAFLREKYPLILFGIYPPSEQWRPLTASVIIIAMALWTVPPSHWNVRTLLLWSTGTLGALMLMSGGAFGLAPVPTSSWGGLPITLLLTVLSLGAGFPLAIALALGRRSELPALRWLSIVTIEIVRGLPLLSILFIASIMLPLVLPEGVTIDKLLRALVALTIFAAAYLAEVLRGGLQAIPRGQIEAAQALGLTWWQATRLIVLPQAISKVIPPLTNTVVVVIKNTSLVLVVGLFDLLSSGRVALTDPAWPTPYTETYLMVALIYFVICFGISRYSLWIERHMAASTRR